MRPRLILFTRLPAPGAVKTRMIPLLGERGAATLHRELTEHTLRTTDALQEEVTTIVRFTGGSREDMAAWLGPDRTYEDQGEGDLGARMSRAFESAFESQSSADLRVCIIGSDCPDLTPELIRDGFRCLTSTDLILGEALDGGYYLIGLRREAWEKTGPDLLRGVGWGTEKVLEETEAIARNHRISCRRLPPLGDVDRPEDLPRWERVKNTGL